MNLLSTGFNHKIEKGNKLGEYLTAHLDLMPADLSGYGNVCPRFSPGCRQACLNTAGWAASAKVQNARKRKTKLWFEDRETFLMILRNDLTTFQRRCKRREVKAAVRLNMTSDLPWERFLDMTQWPGVQFYDYTKVPLRRVPENYHLTFSLDETNYSDAMREIETFNRNVAAVVAESSYWHIVQDKKADWTCFGHPVLDGDKHDLRFLDAPGHIVILKAKGRARNDETGFVLDILEERVFHDASIRPGDGSVHCAPVFERHLHPAQCATGGH